MCDLLLLQLSVLCVQGDSKRYKVVCNTLNFSLPGFHHHLHKQGDPAVIILYIFSAEAEVCPLQEYYGGVILHSQRNPINHHLLYNRHGSNTASAKSDS